MGTFGTGILENDGAMDVYHSFLDRYFMGEDLETIKSSTLKTFGFFDESGRPVLKDQTNEWLAFALACWECQTLEDSTFRQIENIYTEEIDADNWEEKWEDRKKNIKKLLRKLSKPAKKPKPIPKFMTPYIPIKIGECFTLKYSNGKYGGAICLNIIINAKKPIRYVYGITRIYMDSVPELNDFLSSHFLVYNYGKTIEGERANWVNNPEAVIKYAFTGKMKIEEDREWIDQIYRGLKSNQSIGFVKIIKSADELISGGNMNFNFSLNHENQFVWEVENPNAINLQYPVSKYCASNSDD